MSDDWAQHQIDHFKFTFRQADVDKSGSLSFDELYNVMKAEGFVGPKTEAAKVFDNLDVTQDKSISEAEFYMALDQIPKRNREEYALRKIFWEMDKDRSGSLTADEIKAALTKKVKVDLPEKKLNAIMELLASDSDGMIDFDEFLCVFQTESRMVEIKRIFDQLDKDKNGFISWSEIISAVKSAGSLKLDADKLYGLMDELATDEDQKISLREFTQYWRK